MRAPRVRATGRWARRRWRDSWRAVPVLGGFLKRRDRLPTYIRRWAQFELLAIVWLFGYTFLTPPMSRAALGDGVAILWVAAVGGIVALVAMVVRRLRPAPHAKMFELAGLYLLGVGPLIHAITLAIIIWSSGVAGGPIHLLVPAFQSLALLAAVRARGAEVREGH